MICAGSRGARACSGRASRPESRHSGASQPASQASQRSSELSRAVARPRRPHEFARSIACTLRRAPAAPTATGLIHGRSSVFPAFPEPRRQFLNLLNRVTDGGYGSRVLSSVSTREPAIFYRSDPFEDTRRLRVGRSRLPVPPKACLVQSRLAAVPTALRYANAVSTLPSGSRSQSNQARFNSPPAFHSERGQHPFG